MGDDVISKIFQLKDSFSGVLDRYIKKLSSAIDRNSSMDNSVTQLQKNLAHANDAYNSYAKSIGAFTDSGTVDMRKLFKSGDFAIYKPLLDDITKAEEALSQRGDELIAEEEQEADATNQTGSAFSRAADAAKNFASSLLGITKNDAGDFLGGITQKLTRMVMFYFSTRKLLSYIRNAVGRAPDEVAKPMNDLKTNISNMFAGPVVSAIAGMNNGINKLNAAFSSPAGQKFARGMETVGSAVGQALGFVIGKISTLIDFLGNHFQTIAEVAIVFVGLLAIKFALFAVSVALAHAPLILLVGLVSLFMVGLSKLGVTASDVFGFVGGLIGWLYGMGYNAVADIYNLLLGFADFFGMFLNDPVDAICDLMLSLADFALGVLENIARGIDAVFGSNLVSYVNQWQDAVQKEHDLVREDAGYQSPYERMEKLDVTETKNIFASKAEALSDSLSDFSLKNAMATSLKDISSDTSSIKDAVTDEDLKYLIDMAEQKFVSNVNLTAQTPVITINGANTGNSEADRISLANTIRDILIEQVASGSSTSSYVYSGG